MEVILETHVPQVGGNDLETQHIVCAHCGDDGCLHSMACLHDPLLGCCPRLLEPTRGGATLEMVGAEQGFEPQPMVLMGSVPATSPASAQKLRDDLAERDARGYLERCASIAGGVDVRPGFAKKHRPQNGDCPKSLGPQGGLESLTLQRPFGMAVQEPQGGIYVELSRL